VRRQKGAKSAEQAQAADAVTDEDLSSAASLAASEIGSGPVMDILEEFGVARVDLLEGDQRQEFLDKVKAVREG